MARQIITFRIAKQFLGLDIMAVREIRAWSSATLIPHAPEYVHGVVNLRGSVLPVVDLSARLGWGRIEPAERHVIIVIQVGDTLQGLIVDAVDDIVTLPSDGLQPAPSLGSDVVADFLEGIAHSDERMVMVLDLSSLHDSDSAMARLAA